MDVLPKSITSLNIRLRRKPLAIPDIFHLGKAAVDGQLPKLKRLTVEAYLRVPKESIQQDRHWTSVVCSPYGELAQEPTIQALKPKLAEAFQGSDVFVDVTGLSVV